MHLSSESSINCVSGFNVRISSPWAFSIPRLFALAYPKLVLDAIRVQLGNASRTISDEPSALALSTMMISKAQEGENSQMDFRHSDRSDRVFQFTITMLRLMGSDRVKS